MKKPILKQRASWCGQLIASALLLVAGTSFAQTNISVGTGTTTSVNTPITSYYGYSYVQNIYLASDLTNAGGAAGNINKVRFYYASGAVNNSNNWTVYIGHTNKNAFANNTDWEVIGNLTNCFSGTVTFPGAGNWVEVTLSTPFAWNGTQNIIIAVDENQAGFASTDANWRTTTTAGVNRTIYYRNDATNPNPAAPPTATGLIAAFANVQLELDLPDCSTLAHASVVPPVASVCPGSGLTLAMDQTYPFDGISYQWEMNDGSGWTPIPGATAATYNTGGLSTATEYRTVVSCSFSATDDIAGAAQIGLYTLPTVTVNHTDIALCGGEPANLAASGADTYVWSPTTMLTPSATSPNVNVIPAAKTLYTVTGTDANGCTGTATSLVTPLAVVRGEATFSPAENCSAGTPVTISVDGLPAEITSGGTWEYRWLAADGTTVVQDWSATNSYTFTPATDGVYDYFYQLRSTSCPADNIDSVKTSITIGFGAVADLTHYNCNTMGGTIALDSIFGQVELSEVYSNAFGPSPDLTNITLTGNASMNDNMARLTASATGVTGYMQIALPAQTYGMNNAMTVSFDMTNDLPINNFGTGGADGLAYSFGNDAIPTANGTGHNGKGTKLRLSFDSAGNGSENGNAPGIYLVYGWTAGNAFGPASAQTIAYSNNIALWKGLTNVPVVLDIDAAGKATVTVNGTVIFDHVQLPSAYMTADVSSWTHLFSAQTGGDAMRQGIANLEIVAGNLNYGITAGGSVTPPATWQAETSFGGLLPGTYDIWISKDEAGSCLKNIGTYEILNTNPIVDLGNDTTICEGESITLDAGNPGSVYTWSGTNAFTQTLEVDEAGSYIVYVTDAAGCTGIGTINVSVNEAPSATGIYSQGNFPTVFFTATGAQNATSYNWNFGDGQTLNGGPVSVSHTYADGGTFNVSVTLVNECGTETVTGSVTIVNTTAVEEQIIDGLEVFPNPASDVVTVRLPNDETSVMTVYATSGAVVAAPETFHATATFNVVNWEKGMYFVRIENQGKTGVYKLVVR